MYVGKHLRVKIVFQYAWQSIVFFTLYSALILFTLVIFLPKFNGLPFAIVSVTGIAVAFYVGFKNNSSYERLWEARKIWGAYVNSSRIFAMYVLDFMNPSNALPESELHVIKQRMIKRHVAYITAVRVQLRKFTVWKIQELANKIVTSETNFITEQLDKELRHFMADAEVDYVMAQNNPAVHILKLQSEDLKRVHDETCLSDFHHIEINRMLADFFNQQGACERIKNYPFPRQYAYYSKIFVYLFIGILPFSIYGELIKLEASLYLMIPVSVILSWIFYTMEVVGDSSENPFENAINDIPMTAICRNIEIDLMQMLKDPNIPSKIAPENDILM